MLRQMLPRLPPVLLLVALATEIDGLLTSSLFRRRGDMDGCHAPSCYATVTTSSRSVCANVCQSQSSCLAFTVDAANKTCFLYDYTPLRGDSRPGAVTYFKNWNSCPADWTFLNDTLCVKLFTETVNWNTALQRCLQLGGHLVSVQTQEKLDFLLAFLRNASVPSTWLGASDAEVEGQWIWVASGESMTLDAWGGGEPNNYGGGENCLLLIVGPPHKFNDAKCGKTRNYVCQLPL